ncbi:MAG TPA: hypothetical protein VGL93_18235 [Streptosporangiaceae bacterium]|jgi:hypothetical protein
MRPTVRTLTGAATALLTTGLTAALVAGPAAAGTTHPARATPGERTAAAAKRAAPPTLLFDCGRATVKPGAFTIACADGNNYLSGIHWRGWGAGKARGVAVQHANDCRPSCANGHFHTFPVRVTVKNPKALPKYRGLRYFSRIRLDYGKARPTHAGHQAYSLAP